MTDEQHDFNGDWLIVFSEYDEDETGKGWYAQDTSMKGWPSTSLFETRDSLIDEITSIQRRVG